MSKYNQELHSNYQKAIQAFLNVYPGKTDKMSVLIDSYCRTCALYLWNTFGVDLSVCTDGINELYAENKHKRAYTTTQVNHGVGAGECLIDGGKQPIGVVSHHALAVDGDAHLRQAAGQIGGVGIDDIAQEQFRADGQNFNGVIHIRTSNIHGMGIRSGESAHSYSIIEGGILSRESLAGRGNVGYNRGE